MTRPTFPESYLIPFHDRIHCRRCRIRVALVSDYVQPVGPGGIFNRVFNVDVSDDVNDHLQQEVNTLANTYCVRCGTLLGWKFIAVPEPSMIIRAGRFCMRLHKLTLWNDVPLHHLNQEQNANQDGGGDGQNTDLNEQVPNQDVDIAEGMGNIDLNANT
ncbi:hypothetical protein KY289_028444 [Solanum tuberosum]|nr:hypothetical protein KY289_028444 [Solanum tuberosum]